MYKKKPLQVYRNGFSLKLFYEKTNKERPLLKAVAKIVQIYEHPTRDFYANTF
jgi:hypothetical protein